MYDFFDEFKNKIKEIDKVFDKNDTDDALNLLCADEKQRELLKKINKICTKIDKIENKEEKHKIIISIISAMLTTFYKPEKWIDVLDEIRTVVGLNLISKTLGGDKFIDFFKTMMGEEE